MPEVKFINPITGKEVDEVIKEKEAKERGYFDFQFMLKYLDDENEFVKYYVIEGKRVIVDITRPMFEYKKKTTMDYERVLQDTTEKKSVDVGVLSTNSACSLDNSSECISCSG